MASTVSGKVHLIDEPEKSSGNPNGLFIRPSDPGMMQSVPVGVRWEDSTEIANAAGQGDEAQRALAAVIDFSLLNDIFENFLSVTGLPIAVVDLDGQVLASSKWQRMCMAFHRAHKDTLARCIASDTILSRQVQEGSECAVYRCANGLTDCATPIIVDGLHVANLFTGQFLMDVPDISFFKRQRELHGFDETEYFQALDNIPIVSREKIPAVLKLLRGLAQQITQLSLANSKLQSTTHMLQTVIDTVPHFVFWKDRHSRYLGGNQALAELAKVSSMDEIVGKSDFDFPWREFAEQYRQDDAKVMETGIGKFNIIEPITTENGTVRWIETSKVPLTDGQGKTFGVLGLFQDVTERKETAEALSRAKEAAEIANTAKSRFLAAVSHDLRQPLSALSLYVTTLERKLPSEYGPLKSSIRNCMGHLNEMLSNLLDLSRLEAGVIKPNVQNFDLDDMLHSVVSSFRPQAHERMLELRLGKSIKTGRTDPTLLQRIVSNLVANAVRYTPAGGVLIGTRRLGGKMWIEVWDTGIGILPEQKREIFEEFRQLGNHERNPEKGTGLGLAIVARTAKLLGLEHRMSSRPGKGSMFAIEVPLGDAPISRKQGQPIRRSLRIALIEDNKHVSAAVTYALTEAGHTVIAGASRRTLLSLLDGPLPDLLISDYRLSEGENGLDVVRALRREWGGNLPALIITGDTAPDVIRRFANNDIAILHKPLDLQTLLSKVEELLG